MSTAPEGPTLAGVGANNRRTHRFREMQAALPAAVQRIVEAAYRKFLENPNHQSLHRKELHDTHRGQHRRGSWSVRVTLKYRAIYVLDGDTNVWYWIGSHSDYNIFTGEN